MNQGSASFGRDGNSEESTRPRMSQVNRYRRASSRRHPPPPSVRLQPLTIVNDDGNPSPSFPPTAKQIPAQIITTTRSVPSVQSGKTPSLPTAYSKRRKDDSPSIHADPPPAVATELQPSPSSRSVAQLHSFLDSLLESCRKHIVMANHTHASEEEEEFTDPISNSLCREAVHALQRILPHVEEGLAQVVVSTPSSTPFSLVESLISRVCELYRDILQGGFCPQAPHLLLHTTDLIPRIYLLFQCLAFQSACIHSKTTLDEYQQVLSIGTQVCQTMAQLINQLPDTRLVHAVVRDLIYLSKDLSVWHVLTTSRRKEDSVIAELQVSLLEETIHTMEWVDAEPKEYLVHFPTSQHSIQSMQWHVFSIIQHFFVIRQQQRLVPDAISSIIEDYDDHYLSLAGDADLYLIPYFDPDELRVLFLSLREVLLTPSSPDSISGLIILCHVQNMVSRLLLLLQSDWHKTSASCISLLQEAAYLVGYIVKHCLTLESHIHMALLDESWLLDLVNGTLDNIAQLLSTLIYNPPNVSGSMPHCAVSGRIQQLLWPILCESILSIKGNGSAVDERCSLDVVLLRLIHAIARGLHCGSSNRLLPNTDVVQHLLYLSNDPKYVDAALFILSSLLFNSANSRSVVLELEYVLKMSYSTHEWHSTDTSATMAIGSKRLRPYSAYNPEKRLKEDGFGNCVSTSFLYFDDAVAFFSAAQDGILRLNSALQQRHEESNISSVDSTSVASIFPDFLLLSSRLRLILLLIESSDYMESSISSLAPFLCRYITDSFASLSLLVEVCRNEYPLRVNEPHVRRLVEEIFICALHIEKATNFENCALVDSSGIFRSVKILANGWNFMTTQEKELVLGLPFRLPTSIHDSAFGFALKYLPFSELEWTTIPPILDLAIMGMSVTIDMRMICGITVIWTGPILKPMDNDVTAQSRRLDLLFSPPGAVQNLIETNQEMTKRCMLALKRYAHMKHSSPVHRLLLWQTCAWIFKSMAPDDIRQSFGPSNADFVFGTSVLHFLVDIAFSDQEPLVREYASRELGNVLSSHDWASLLALLASEAEWQQMKRSDNDFLKKAASLNKVAEQIISRFFQGIDDIVLELLSKSDPQSNNMVLDGFSDVTGFRRSAARAFCSLCFNRNSFIGEGKFVVQHAMVRIVHLLTAFDDLVHSGLCLAELSFLSHRADMGLNLHDDYWPTTAPYLIQGVFSSKSRLNDCVELTTVDIISSNLKERLFIQMSAFIRAAALNDFSDSEAIPLSWTTESDLERTFELWLPHIVSNLVADKNHGALQFSMSYRLYLRGQHRADFRLHKRSGPLSLEGDLLCGFFSGDISKTVPSRHWNRDLDNVTREFCLEPGLIEQIVPLIFTKSGLDGINFFLKDVLQGKVTIQQLVKSREMFTLKYFVLELGRHPGSTELVVDALKKAAIIRQSEASDVGFRSSYEADDIVSRDAVGNWVSTHFMYLLVNVVQAKWTSKTTAQKISSLRCLLPVLDFLHSTESAQYFPQVLASVNAALSDGSSGIFSSREMGHFAQLKLIAVLFLSKFVKVIAETQIEFLGQNLTSIVVSLVPIVSMTRFSLDASGFENEYQRQGVALLEWLSGKEVLLSYFAEIPFLPSTSALDRVRASLKSRGISFDNLQTVSTQGTQDASRRAVASDCGSTDGDSRGAAIDASRQGALRHRLETICPLLENESVSVRRVVLQHITGLLRANRDLFHALVENEGTTSWKQFLTVTYGDKNGFHRWSLTNFIELFLTRCTKENDSETRTLLATCFGEVGAINANRFDDMETHAGSHSRHTTDPPWHTAPHQFQFQLLTTYLVVALKAATASNDQHKIAFAIQQLLDLLNDAGKEGLLLSSFDDGSYQGSSSKSKISTISFADGNDMLQKPKMNNSLLCRLNEAQVLDVVEPFWTSDFHETGSTRPKTPPFFCKATTFYDWLSTWCRYMVHCAYGCRTTTWTKMFHCCRTALRTQSGLGIAELLLPFLVLDRLCFGNGQDHMMLLSEIKDVLLNCDNDNISSGSAMAPSEIRKAVSTIFSLLDLLQHWVEPEVESKYCKKTRSPGKEAHIPSHATSCDWQLSESAMRIEDLLSKVPLELRGKAAYNVGMYATALRFLEMASRLTVVDVIFGIDQAPVSQPKPNRSRASGQCPEEVVCIMKEVLASLDDCSTVEALVGDYKWVTPEAQTKDSIRQKESQQDWQGALHEYERALQQNIADSSIRLGSLHCLLQLGHFDNILQKVNYMRYKAELDKSSPDYCAGAVPIAVEAACRLGRWDALSELVEDETFHSVEAFSSDSLYQLHLGKALLDVKRKSLDDVLGSLNRARLAVMDSLANVAMESYSRSYDHLVRLQALREIEDVSELLCSSNSHHPRLLEDYSIAWNRRLDLVSSSGATTIMNVRLVLARLANDSVFEGSLFLRMGKRARKSGLLSAAANAFSLAESAFQFVEENQKATWKSAVVLQSAKLSHSLGESSIALRMIGLDDIESMGILKDNELVAASCQRVVENLGIDKQDMNEKEILDIFVRSALQSTRWMIEGGLKEAAEIVARFRVIHNVAPSFEKGHLHFAKYIDSLLQSRILALQGRYAVQFTGGDDELLRDHIISRDKACIRYVVLAIKHFAEALILDVKHVYQVLPRLLSLWFDFTGIANGKENFRSGLPEGGLELESLLSSCQDEVNKFMAATFKKISAQALYTSIPQLISRITHDDNDTAAIVQAMLRRVLIKYPAQAMWPLGWIRQSRDPQRQQIGVDIFHQATEALNKRESLHRLLVTSKTLLDYLYALAKKDVGDKVKDSMKVRPLSDEVNLSEFVPPIQAALSASLASGDSSRSRDVFPRHIPRMRAIDETVGVMASKARPKKIKVYVIAADSVAQLRKGNSDCFDIGEIHFLLKQEAKGDLRKDARVQDLNNVVNRVMSSMDHNKRHMSQSRRLHLRTFCVTCLSEDTGLLEWVPHTASLRSMISKTYNPQANPVHGKRHGKRITNFNDPNLRVKFESVCQAAYFVSGNLTKAAALFENECLSKYPPVLYWWYVLQFPDPHAWYEARTRFALSTAAWSAVGHVIGLGDRHSENILLDKTSGECVHVDFDCIFDKGLYLPKPEVVPFRLTQNMVDALGPTGADGVYTWNLKAAMSALRNNRDTLLSVLEPFVKDPVINWKRYRSQQRGSHRTTENDPMLEAKQKMIVIDERLRGIYNLRNPNLKKIRRTDHLESQQDDELSHPIPLSVEGQVHKLIAEATSNENLVQLYVGWMPWV